MPRRSVRAFVIGMLIAGSLLTMGCQCHRLGLVPPGFRNDVESGIAVIGKEYTFSANTTVQSGQPVLFTLKSNENITYNGKTIHPDFRAYVKPPMGVAASDIHVNFTVPMIDIITGWAYLVGTSPMGKTTRVRAVGEGTRMIIEVDDTVEPAVHRVYLVGDAGSKVYIHVPESNATAVYTMKEIGSYIEVYENNAWAPKGLYSADPARAAFVAAVLKEVQGARVK
jgi:hypothetical protein